MPRAADLRCDFRVLDSTARASAAVSALQTTPEALKFSLGQYEALLGQFQTAASGLDSLTVSQRAVQTKVDTDERYLQERVRVAELERDLEHAQTRLRVATQTASTYSEKLRSWLEAQKSPQQVFDLAQAVELKQRQLEDQANRAYLVLQSAQARARADLEQELVGARQAVRFDVELFERQVRTFAQAVAQIQDTVKQQAAELLRQAVDAQVQVDQLCTEFNGYDEARRPQPPEPEPEPEPEPILQRSQTFLADVQKLLVSTTATRVWDLQSETSKCAVTESREPAAFQRMWAELGSRRVRDARVLFNWRAGTGKSCLASTLIQKQILAQAEAEARPVGILVLVYSPGEFEKYARGQSEAWCSLPGWSSVSVEVTEVRSGRDKQVRALVSEFRQAGRLLGVLRVQKFTYGPKGHRVGAASQVFDPDEGLPLSGGMVIVDEAHYLFDARELAGDLHVHTSKYVRGLLRLEGVKQFLLTATPTSNSTLFENVFRMVSFLDAIRTGPETLAFGLSAKQVAEPWPLDSKWRAELFERFFERDPDGGTKWRPGKREEFTDHTKQHVSFVTLEHDRGVYPQFTVKPLLQELLVPDTASEQESAQLRFEHGRLTFVKRMSAGLPHIEVRVPYARSAKLEVEIKGKLQRQGTRGYGTYFKQTKTNPRPEKWDAIESFIRARPSHKFFVFSPSRTWTHSGLPEFGAETLGRRLGMDRFGLSAGTRALWSSREAFLDRAFKDMGSQKPRYVELSSKERRDERERDLFAMYAALWNDPRNKDGSWIRVVTADNEAREAISLFDTHYELQTEPPRSGSAMRQIAARIARNCGFTSANTRDWWVTVVVFVAESPGNRTETFETKNMELVNRDAATPTGLLEAAMQQTAMDCALLSDLNQVRCDVEGEREIEQGQGQEDSRKPSRPPVLCWYADARLGVVSVESAAQCVGFVDFDEYGVWDEIVFQLLNSEDRERGPQLQELDPTVAHRLLKAVWATTTPLQSYVSYRTRPKPEVFLVWLQRADRAPPAKAQGQVLRWFAGLLSHRRALVAPEVLDALEARAKLYVTAFKKAQGLGGLELSVERAKTAIEAAELSAVAASQELAASAALAVPVDARAFELRQKYGV